MKLTGHLRGSAYCCGVIYGFAFFLRVAHCDGTKIGQGNEDLLLVPNSLLSSLQVVARRKQIALPPSANISVRDNLSAWFLIVSGVGASISEKDEDGV